MLVLATSVVVAAVRACVPVYSAEKELYVDGSDDTKPQFEIRAMCQF